MFKIAIVDLGSEGMYGGDYSVILFWGAGKYGAPFSEDHI